MTAICGVIDVDGRAWPEADLSSVVIALGRGEGRTWSGVSGRAWVGLGGAGGAKPATGADGSLVAVADARITNRLDLVAELGCRTDRLAPAELLLAGYEKWGHEGLLSRLSGVFAFAVVDCRKGGVLLARDHLGQRPLVVAERPGFVAFASHALALTAVEAVGHDLDETYVAEVLSLAYRSGRTFVEGVRWLGPGQALWVSTEQNYKWNWWRPPSPVQGSLAQHATLLRDALDRAVAADVDGGPVGVVMSGGLDSTSVAATAAALIGPTPLATYTSVPPPGWSGPATAGFDVRDGSLARDLADAYSNVEPRFVDVVGRPFTRGIYEGLWQLGGGVPRNPCNFVWISAIAERAAAEGIPTLLTGGLGNLAFSADGPDWLRQLWQERRVAELMAESRAWAHRPGGSWGQVARYVLSPAVPPVGRRARLRVFGDRTPTERAQMSALRPELAYLVDLPALYPLTDRTRHTSHRDGLFIAAGDFAHQADTFAALDRLRGVEHRDPTADRRLWETALAQPEYVRRHAGVSRAVVRKAMAPRLPESILNRRTVGIQLPDWLDRMTEARGELRQEIDALRDHETCRRLIDVDRLDRLERHWPSPGRAADPAIVRGYREALLRGTVVGKYLRWFDGHAAAGRR
jgi:asparagine synthase (glutamine-hydrolysing)